MQVSKYILFFLLVSFLSCDSDDFRNSEVPSVVLNSFKIRFPEAVDVSWEQQQNAYEVEFEIGRIDHTVLLDATGEVVKLKQEITLEEVPAAILNSLQKNFDQEDFEDPEKVLIGTETYFQLEIDQFLLDEKVVLDKNGRISEEVSYWE